MGHFSPEVYLELSKLLGAELSETIEEDREFGIESRIRAHGRSAALRVVRSLTKPLVDRAYRWSRKPGPNLFAVFRKG